jgi:hypothetical protein
MTVTTDPKPATNHRSAETDSSVPIIANAETDDRDDSEDDNDDRDDSEDDNDDRDDSEDDNDDRDDSEDGDEADPRRVAFLNDLPDAEELRPLVESFVEGNYALLRQQEQALRTQSKDPEILAAARELVERTEPDPLSKILLWLSVLFFLFVVGWVYLHHGQ